MRRRTTAIIVAVVLALAAAGLVVWYVSTLRQEATTAEATQAVLVAVADIPERTTGEAMIEHGLLQRQEVPLKAVTPGALISEAGLQDKVLTIRVAKGQQLLQSQFGIAEQQSLSFKLKQGMRALSLPIDRDCAVGGQIAAGDRVDVIATFKSEEMQQVQLPIGSVLTPVEAERVKQATGLDLTKTISPISRMLLQQVEVLAVDVLQEGAAGGGTNGVFTQAGATDQAVPDKPVIVLMVSPADAEKLVFAQSFGKVWFTLVPAEDSTEVKTLGQSLVNLLK